ncbi:hypothetical protein NVP1023O_41 [Vibrio phage 1.023.O._10N.222.51.B4]|nr:hypothetical protein NVP1023O_41 [Vibrio phage 1.023.O._10N.222.51.B4]
MAKLNYPRVVDWAMHRRILDESTAQSQMLKGTEEHGEMATAILNGDRDELIDAVGDQLVVAIIQCAQLGYTDELEEWLDVPSYSFYKESEGALLFYKQRLSEALLVTVQQGNVAASLARSRCARGDFDNLFDHLFRLCYVFGVSPHQALDSVYDIISKRDGVMRNGVWVKVGDL